MLKLERDRLLASTVLSGIAAGLLATTSAMAQDAPAPAAAAVADSEEVTVTGTRITRPGITSSSPVTSVSAEEIRLQQKTDVEEIIRELPGSLPGDNEGVNNGTAGVTTINLRGLGTQRNLILVDGKRLVPYSVDGIVDVSTIPLALLERIDVATGGASAVYGSDAISGAVNFIMKKNFEGVALDTTYSITGEGDGNTVSTSATIGANLPDDRGNVTLSMNYTDRRGVQLGARDFGILAIATDSGAAGGGSGTAIPSKLSLGIPNGFGFTNGRGLNPDGTFGAVVPAFNFNPFNYFQTPQERYSAFASANYEISPEVEAYTKVIFANTKVRQQIAPSGLFGDSFDVPLLNPFIPAAGRAQIIGAYNAFLAANPTFSLGDVGVTDENGNGIVDEADTANVAISRRTTELGARSTTFENTSYQFTFGLRGDFGDSWDWDVSYQHGRVTRTQLNAGYVNLDAAQEALLTTSATACASGNALCVPLNAFGDEGSITPAMANFISGFALLNQEYNQDIINGSVTGDLGFMLPWAESPISVALGAEYRQEKGASFPDQCLLTACLGGLGGASPGVSGGYDVYELFAEAIIPIIENKPGAYLLQIELGGRMSEYSATGQNNTWKAGIEYAPFEEVRFRGTYQKAVRAPNVTEIATPVTGGLDDAVEDPCSGTLPLGNATLIDRCIYTGVNPAFIGGIPDISAGQINGFFGTDPLNLPNPEKADTQTYGVVFTPDLGDSPISGLAITVDYYDISIDDYIGNVTAQEILDGCYIGGDLNLCDRVIRVNSNLVNNGSGIQEYTTNLTNLKASGIEVGLAFKADLDTWGSLDVSFNGNYYIENEFQSLSTLPVVECVGVYGKSCGNPTSEYRFSQRTVWTYDDFQFTYLWRYLSAVDVEPGQRDDDVTFPAFQHIDAYHYFDVGVGYQVMEEVNLTFNVSNVFDKEPPIIGNDTATTSTGSGNTLPSVYDTLGRTFALGVNLRF